jgi:hypothetical protein
VNAFGKRQAVCVAVTFVTETETGRSSLLTLWRTSDELGRVKSRAIDNMAQAASFDALGRVTAVTNALGMFTNNYVGVTPRLDSVIYPNGQTTTFTCQDKAV